jgi:hypothetical protein
MDVDIDEEMRMNLLAEEFKLRKKQPPAWTMQKYRKYANFGANRKKKEDVPEAKGNKDSVQKVEAKN